MKKHRFNERLFCEDCSADAIGLKARGSGALICKPKLAPLLPDAERCEGAIYRADDLTDHVCTLPRGHGGDCAWQRIDENGKPIAETLASA